MNAGGLWARRVGNMVGIDHPLVPMPHHYLVTDTVPQVAAIDGDMPAVTDRVLLPRRPTASGYSGARTWGMILHMWSNGGDVGAPRIAGP